MEFQAPISSPAFQELLRLAQRHGQNVDELRRLLWLVNAHPQLVAHAQVLENVGTLLRSAVFSQENVSWAGAWKDSIPFWLELCDWLGLPSTQKVLAARIPHFFYAPIARHPLLGNGVVRHGVVAALWSRHEDHEFAGNVTAPTQFRRLQAHLLCTVFESRNIAGTLDDFERYEYIPERPIAPTRTYSVGLSIRELSHREHAGLLVLLPTSDESVTYARAARETAAPNLSSTEERCLSAIRNYFQRFLEFRINQRPTRLRRVGLGGGGKKRVHGYIQAGGIDGAMFGEAPPSEQEVDDIPLWIQDLYTKTEIAEFATPAAIEDSGLSPIEVSEPFLSLYSPETNGKKTQGTAYQRDSIETRLQNFPFDTQFLTPYEIGILESALNALILELLASQLESNAERIKLLSALALRLMLATGRELDAALNIGILNVAVGNEPAEQSTDIDLGLVIVISDAADNAAFSVGGFILRAISPSYKTELREDLQAVDLDNSSYFLIPDTIGVGQQLLDAMRALHDPTLTSFSKHRSQIRKEARHLLAQFEESRFSLKKVAKVLGNQIAAQSGDSTLAWMICGQTNMSDQPRMFYTRYSQAQITEAYLQATEKISPSTFVRRIAVDWNPADGSGSGERRQVGARFVAPLEIVQETISAILAFLGTPPENRDDKQWRVTYHLVYTAYTHMFQSFETTLRTTMNPDAPYKNWCTRGQNSESYVTINDKGSYYDDRARLVKVSSPLAEQYSNFRRHLQLAPLHILDKRRKLESRWHFYTWNDFLHPAPFTPADYELVLKYFSSLNLPSNFHRAFLRSELLRRGCNPEIIDAFLGHANAGELPFGRFSSFDFHLFCEELGRYLAAIRTDLGFRPIRSLIGTERLHFATS